MFMMSWEQVVVLCETNKLGLAETEEIMTLEVFACWPSSTGMPKPKFCTISSVSGSNIPSVTLMAPRKPRSSSCRHRYHGGAK